LTDKKMSDIMSNIVVVVDSREKQNDHILSYLKDNDIPYIVEKLHSADYSFILPDYPELNMDRKILVEKKNSLDEISQNFTSGRERFAREFERLTDEKIHLVVEDATWKKLTKGSYRSKLPPKSFTASMLTWSIRYRCPVWFVGRDESPELIHKLLHYELLEFLKGMK